MEVILEWVRGAGDTVVWVAGVGGALLVVYRWMAKPLKSLTKCTEMLMGDRLAQAFAHWTGKGYCPRQDKERLSDMYEEYKSRGLNHLKQQDMQTLLCLPDEPQKSGERMR